MMRTCLREQTCRETSVFLLQRGMQAGLEGCALYEERLRLLVGTLCALESGAATKGKPMTEKQDGSLATGDSVKT